MSLRAGRHPLVGAAYPPLFLIIRIPLLLPLCCTAACANHAPRALPAPTLTNPTVAHSLMQKDLRMRIPSGLRTGKSFPTSATSQVLRWTSSCYWCRSLAGVWPEIGRTLVGVRPEFGRSLVGVWSIPGAAHCPRRRSSRGSPRSESGRSLIGVWSEFGRSSAWRNSPGCGRPLRAQLIRATDRPPSHHQIACALDPRRAG
jgi:hypothetical protein